MIFYICGLVIVCIFILYCFFRKSTYGSPSDCLLPHTSKEIQKKVSKILFDVDKLFQDNDINYWAEGGTLLGIVRHKGIIPWDDDTDICIMENDYEKVLNLKNEFRKLGYVLLPVFFGFKVHPFEGKTINKRWEAEDTDTYTYKYPFLDIFIRQNYNDKIVLSQTSLWENFYFLQEEVYPIKRYRFNDFYINGPNKPLPYLDRGYRDWETILFSYGGHIQEGEQNNVFICENKEYPINISNFI